MSEDSLASFFVADHRACDDAWTELEASATGEDLPRARASWAVFLDAVESNFRREEDVLFPAFEAATGATGGPTVVMRHEHKQMRGLLSQMRDAVEKGDLQALLDLGDTLLMVMQQHNVKEEGILFPMADRQLAGVWFTMRAKLKP